MDDHGKLLRLFREINLLASHKKGFTAEELAERLGVTYRTIYRDIKIFEKTGFEIVQSKSKRFRLIKSNELSDHLAFNREEAQALKSAVKLLPSGGMKSLIEQKIATLSVAAHQANALIKTSMSANVNLISKAIAEKKQCILHDYNSLNSSVIRDRFVEPFTFTENGDMVRCFEPSSKKSKAFKIERIGLVKILERDWEHEHLHEEKKQDLFGITYSSAIRIKMKLGMLSYVLLREEYPAAQALIKKLNPKEYELEIEVADFKGIGRFCLGLMEDIEVIEPLSFKEYLKERIANQKLFKA